MNDFEREQFKKRLQAFDESSRGIELDTPSHWAIDGVDKPISFFEHLSLLMGQNSILYFEGVTIVPEVAIFYAKHKAINPLHVSCDTIFPVPDTYHVNFSSKVITNICELISKYPRNCLFDHIKGYQFGTLIFTFHDAFQGCLRISGNIPETTVIEFCRALKVSYYCEFTERKSPNQLRGLLNALEHPDQVKIRGESWWKRLERKWKLHLKKKT